MKGKEVTRNGVRGHIVHVAPKEGYDRFVPRAYDKDDAPRRRTSRTSGR